MDIEAIEDTESFSELNYGIGSGTGFPLNQEPIIIRGCGNITVFGLHNRFKTDFPPSLLARVAPEEFKGTVEKVNSILGKALPLQMKWVLFGCFCCCCTLGCSFWPVICLSKKTKLSVEKLLEYENSHLYRRLGLKWKLAQLHLDASAMLEGIHKTWDPCTLTLDNWGELFKDERLTVRYGKKTWNGLQPQWESECGKVDLKWKEIIDWKNGEYEFLPDGKGKPEDIWLYYDYRYLPDVFHFGSSKDDKERDFLKVITFNENLKKKFCWSKLGFPERNSDHSTLWIGSKGSYTPCHFDTYSCNLVCQVFGRKRWILFPPKDTDNLLPTRIPYEESSVYSQINFGSPKRLVSHAQDLEKCTPYQITLEAGDCLFLPQKWWHFVQSEDFSISVNTWIELPGDHSVRLEEAILRSVTSTVVNMTFPDASKQILNPNEMDVADLSEMDLNELLQGATSAYIESQRAKMLTQQTPLSPPPPNHQITDNNTVIVAGQSNSCCSESTTPTSSSPSPTLFQPPPRKKSKKRILTLSDFLHCYSTSVACLSPVNYQSLLLFQDQEDPERRQHNNEDQVVASTSTSSSSSSSSSTVSRSPSYLEHLINAIGHPSILKGIAEQFLKNVTQSPPK